MEQRIDYDAFGRVTQNTNPGFQPFGYAGGLSDEDTKLVRFGVRDYDPETGRWTVKDPVVSGGASSRYVYADNEPLGLYDPSGHWPRLVDVANFAAGFGDAVTFGLTNAIRDLIDANGTVNRRMLAYLGGAVAGIAAQVAFGSALSLNSGSLSVFWPGALPQRYSLRMPRVKRRCFFGRPLPPESGAL